MWHPGTVFLTPLRSQTQFCTSELFNVVKCPPGFVWWRGKQKQSTVYSAVQLWSVTQRTCISLKIKLRCLRPWQTMHNIWLFITKMEDHCDHQTLNKIYIKLTNEPLWNLYISLNYAVSTRWIDMSKILHKVSILSLPGCWVDQAAVSYRPFPSWTWWKTGQRHRMVLCCQSTVPSPFGSGWQHSGYCCLPSEQINKHISLGILLHYCKQ